MESLLTNNTVVEKLLAFKTTRAATTNRPTSLWNVLIVASRKNAGVKGGGIRSPDRVLTHRGTVELEIKVCGGIRHHPKGCCCGGTLHS